MKVHRLQIHADCGCTGIEQRLSEIDGHVSHNSLANCRAYGQKLLRAVSSCAKRLLRLPCNVRDAEGIARLNPRAVGQQAGKRRCCSTRHTSAGVAICRPSSSVFTRGTEAGGEQQVVTSASLAPKSWTWHGLRRPPCMLSAWKTPMGMPLRLMQSWWRSRMPHWRRARPTFTSSP